MKETRTKAHENLDYILTTHKRPLSINLHFKLEIIWLFAITNGFFQILDI